jgi:hypothetical protein
MMRRVLLGLLILVSLASPAQAAWPNEPLAFTLDDKTIYQPVGTQTWCMDCIGVDYTTQEPWVVNRTTCTWDVDDRWTYRGAGVLAAGATASFSECSLRSRVDQNLASTNLSSPSPNLVVTYSFAWDAGSYVVAVPPVWDPAYHRYDYDACIDVPFPYSGTDVEIPDSHGGTAVPVTVTGSITNAGGKIGKTGGAFSYGLIPYAVDC